MKFSLVFLAFVAAVYAACPFTDAEVRFAFAARFSCWDMLFLWSAE